MRTHSQSWEIEHLPDTPGKRVLLKILNTPKPDFTQLKKEVEEYHKLRQEERERILLEANNANFSVGK